MTSLDRYRAEQKTAKTQRAAEYAEREARLVTAMTEATGLPFTPLSAVGGMWISLQAAEDYLAPEGAMSARQERTDDVTKRPSTPRCNDCGVKVEGFDNYTIYDPGLGRSAQDYCRRCYGKVNFGKVASRGSAQQPPG